MIAYSSSYPKSTSAILVIAKSRITTSSNFRNPNQSYPFRNWEASSSMKGDYWSSFCLWIMRRKSRKSGPLGWQIHYSRGSGMINYRGRKYWRLPRSHKRKVHKGVKSNQRSLRPVETRGEFFRKEGHCSSVEANHSPIVHFLRRIWKEIK